MENNTERVHHPFSKSEIYQSLISELKIPSNQDAVFLKEIHREIIFVRDDQIHPIISGNKWRKLKHHLQYFNNDNYSGISSMGGAYSNHLHALAYLCNQLKIPCTLFVYGWNGELNSPTLKDCLNWNAVLKPISRSQAAQYRIGNFSESDIFTKDHYWIPEGGGGVLGVQGLKELVDELPKHFDQEDSLIVCACGTGTTIQGILDYTNYCKIMTLQVVKMANYPWSHHQRMRLLNSNRPHSFAKVDQTLRDFISIFNKRYGILLDPVYTAPLMRVFIQIPDWNQYKSIYFIHTGGLQANRMI